jgi:hypothetical protein
MPTQDTGLQSGSIGALSGELFEHRATARHWPQHNATAAACRPERNSSLGASGVSAASTEEIAGAADLGT